MARATVLIVEGDAGIRELLQAALEDAGYGVIADAGDGAAWPPQAPPDLILLDVSATTLGGLARHLRQRIRAAAPVPVIAMTTTPARARVPIAADAWLVKPFHLAELYAVVQRWTEHRARSA